MSERMDAMKLEHAAAKQELDLVVEAKDVEIQALRTELQGLEASLVLKEDALRARDELEKELRAMESGHKALEERLALVSAELEDALKQTAGENAQAEVDQGLAGKKQTEDWERMCLELKDEILKLKVFLCRFGSSHPIPTTTTTDMFFSFSSKRKTTQRMSNLHCMRLQSWSCILWVQNWSTCKHSLGL